MLFLGFFVELRRPARRNRTTTHFPSPTVFRSGVRPEPAPAGPALWPPGSGGGRSVGAVGRLLRAGGHRDAGQQSERGVPPDVTGTAPPIGRHPPAITRPAPPRRPTAAAGHRR